MLPSRFRWLLLMISLAVALVAAGCKSTGGTKAEPPARPIATEPETESGRAAPAAEEAEKVSKPEGESEAIQAARKLGTSTDNPVVSTDSGLKYIDVKPGEGAAAEAGQTAVVHYTGWLVNGRKFDSSLNRGTPFRFTIGRGQVIKGWDEGVAGMKPRGVRKLIVPPQLGYGDMPMGNIPPGSTLIFEVLLLKAE